MPYRHPIKWLAVASTVCTLAYFKSLAIGFAYVSVGFTHAATLAMWVGAWCAYFGV